MRTIRVMGKGQLKVRPDMTRITVILEGTFPEYGEALRRSAEVTEGLGGLLAPFGFERRDPKTLNFSVDTEYERYRDANNEYKERFVGYKYRHVMKVEFPSDNERLGKILYALAKSLIRPEFRLSYTVKDPEAAKNELLAKAVSDAKEKAAVLAASAGVRLLDIQSIDYSWGQIDLEISPMNRSLMAEDCLSSPMAAGTFDMDIEPDDINLTDTVTVLWEIG